MRGVSTTTAEYPWGLYDVEYYDSPYETIFCVDYGASPDLRRHLRQPPILPPPRGPRGRVRPCPDAACGTGEPYWAPDYGLKEKRPNLYAEMQAECG